MNPKNRQVISSATKRAHREPRPIHTPKTSTVKNREGPPHSPVNVGGGGEHPEPEHTDFKDGIFKEKNGVKPNSIPLLGTESSYYCPLINFPPTILSLILSLFYLSSLFGKIK
jgi:hypothetical protein